MPSDAPSVARVHIESWRSTYRGILRDEFLATLSLDRGTVMWQDALKGHSFSYVAEDDAGQVVGFVVAGRARERMADYEGELYAIYLDQQFHGRGIGKRLFLRLSRRWFPRASNSMMLWVLAENPTRGFYEAMGGREVGEKHIEIGGQRVLEVAYGWDRLDAAGRTEEGH